MLYTAEAFSHGEEGEFGTTRPEARVELKNA
jgi:hypothetical protein